MRAALLGGPLALLPLLSCDDLVPAPSTAVWTEGQLCLEDGRFAVDFSGCISSSCDTVTDTTCEAELVDGVVSVTATATVLTEGLECTADCGLVETDCAVPAGAEDATVQWGDLSATMAELAAGTCLGEPWL
jgi:type 1 fimbria pilin